MGFKIQYHNKWYTGKAFAEMPLNDDYALNAAQFLFNWFNDKPFGFLTSGSTGNPKQFVFKKQQLQAGAQATIAALGLIPNREHLLLCLNPKFVGGSMMIARALELDCELTLLDPKENLSVMLPHDHPYSFASFVPMQLMKYDVAETTLNRFGKILIGGSTLPASMEALLNTLKPHCYHTYGMTETLSHIALRRVGKQQSFYPLPGVQISLSDNNCISIRTPFISNPVITHDVVELLHDGSFKFIGRTDFVINSGGIKMHPEQIENALAMANERYQFINGEFIISSVDDVVLGNKCVLVLRSRIGEEEFNMLVNAIKKDLPPYHFPKEMRLISGWPLTQSGKTDRKAVNELLNNEHV